MNHIGEETKKEKTAHHHEMYIYEMYVKFCDIVSTGLVCELLGELMANVLASRGVYNVVLFCSIRFLIYDVCL